MSVTATGAEFGVALQKQAFYEDPFVVSQHTWYKIPSIGLNVSPQQNIQQFPPEMDGRGLPKGEYKATIGFAGDVTLIPRLKGELGWLVLAALGKVTTTANSPVTGAYRHLFTFANDVFSLPWLAIRRKLPGLTSAGTYGEVGWDCRVQELNITIPPTGQMTASINLVGLRTIQDHNPAWVDANAILPDITTSPLTNLGYVRLAGENYRVQNASFMVRNELSTPQEEQVIGSLFAGDITVKQRVASVTMTLIYEDGKVLSRLIANSAVGEEVSPEVFTTITGAEAAFEAFFFTNPKIVGTTPFSISFRANRVTWKISRPPQLQANQLIVFEIVGTVQEPVGDDYVEIEIINDSTSYVAPVAPLFSVPSTQASFAAPYSAIVVDNALTFTSPLTNLNGGTLQIEMTSNNTATTQLVLTPQTIGAVQTPFNGANGQPLRLTLDTDATPAQIQAELRTLTFRDTAATPARGTRTLKIIVTDTTGGVARYFREIVVS